MKIEQFVMAYGVEQDRLRAILPDGFASLRPVLRINAEIRDGKTAYLECNTAVERDGMKGWLNICFWSNVFFEKKSQRTTFRMDHLNIAFTRTGIEGGCPAEKDNDGCCFLSEEALRPPEIITSQKEFCDCSFRWDFDGSGSFGESIGKTLPAIFTPGENNYPKLEFTAKNAAMIKCDQVLGSYVVEFERIEAQDKKYRM